MSKQGCEEQDTIHVSFPTIGNAINQTDNIPNSIEFHHLGEYRPIDLQIN